MKEKQRLEKNMMEQWLEKYGEKLWCVHFLVWYNEFIHLFSMTKHAADHLEPLNIYGGPKKQTSKRKVRENETWNLFGKKSRVSRTHMPQWQDDGIEGALCY